MSITNAKLVKESNWALYRARWNVPTAAKHCGMTKREMKMTFREFLKYHPPDYMVNSQLELDLLSN
ncbi:hypothetical protein SSZBM1_212 [Synechococcus phage S-SZBM1]|uniref:Uncharacterized protein n=1 Tax=Synechococcus phage S-SZBM1 TaxID=2926475 RepID=A0AC61TSY6_9CAUD|nr:hypothetical protein PP650_gp064 [Synechococcus phage S-SZBM1]UNH61329.1 hypothetical protein SSZBM1_212 [Synechococcus phage S-SZBM1]